MGLEPVAEEEEEVTHFEAIYFDLTNLLIDRNGSISSIESITRLPNLLQAYRQRIKSIY